MTPEQYRRTEEALVTAIERAETPEAVIFQKREPPTAADEGM